MSGAVEIACEAAEQLFDSHPELRPEEVTFGSSVLAEVLWPHFRLDHYEGPEGGLFADLQACSNVDSSFLMLLEDDELLVDSKAFLAELGALRDALQAQRANLPGLFELVDSAGHVFVELNRGDARAVCGYDHCALLSPQGDLIADLRRESQIILAGQPVRVVRRDPFAVIDPELARAVAVALTATKFRRGVELRAS